MNDNQRGLYGKYRVTREDGEDHGPYFILAFTSDPHAGKALAVYAESSGREQSVLTADSEYQVVRADGKDKGPYFVLAYAHDWHARKALAAYADSCAQDFPLLAADLRSALVKYRDETPAA
ncbi:Uncharacterised protein [Mycobacteroides abscessus subsp. abscessus]|uniref:hypothetical protein n=1 Tax=Mycobacteroides abscessus TaxID=36809 RepID=UPI00092A27BA|nr:hypothetical protein [Mycobacteroides abscessus]SIJ20721.1 Uncharacterised protein [Mycobacteroides abscessus subsp. abscessus]SLH39554.1 Uncharacterised protein [Mycobacteroides abscessus subsp. abscessus]